MALSTYEDCKMACGQWCIRTMVCFLPAVVFIIGIMFLTRPHVQAGPRSVLITGSSRGIGLATAAKFLEQGDQVTLFCRHEVHVKAAAKLLPHGNRDRLLALTGDVRSLPDLKRIFAAIIKQFGKLDLLINNAGIGLYKPIEQTSETEWDEVVGINLKGQFLCTQMALPLMRQQGSGMIINISSGLGVHTEAFYGAYSASKFGIMALTEVTADETKPDNIRVYAVMPGGVATKLHLDMHPGENPDTMMQPEYIAEKLFELAKGEHPTGFQMPIYS